jgi:hypothetical protein
MPAARLRRERNLGSVFALELSSYHVTSVFPQKKWKLGAVNSGPNIGGCARNSQPFAGMFMLTAIYDAQNLFNLLLDHVKQ